jgi:hypothetical protein
LCCTNLLVSCGENMLEDDFEATADTKTFNGALSATVCDTRGLTFLLEAGADLSY